MSESDLMATLVLERPAASPRGRSGRRQGQSIQGTRSVTFVSRRGLVRAYTTRADALSAGSWRSERESHGDYRS